MYFIITFNESLKNFFPFFLFFVLSCSSVPKNTVNACAIFNEKYLLYKFAKATERKWGAPIEFRWQLLERKVDMIGLRDQKEQNYLKSFLGKEKSSFLGYSQAIENTWETYKSTGKKYVTRVLFKDSSDFVGWYVDQTYRKMKVSKTTILNNIYIIIMVGPNNLGRNQFLTQKQLQEPPRNTRNK